MHYVFLILRKNHIFKQTDSFLCVHAIGSDELHSLPRSISRTENPVRIAKQSIGTDNRLEIITRIGPTYVEEKLSVFIKQIQFFRTGFIIVRVIDGNLYSIVPRTSIGYLGTFRFDKYITVEVMAGEHMGDIQKGLGTFVIGGVAPFSTTIEN